MTTRHLTDQIWSLTQDANDLLGGKTGYDWVLIPHPGLGGVSPSQYCYNARSTEAASEVLRRDRWSLDHPRDPLVDQGWLKVLRWLGTWPSSSGKIPEPDPLRDVKPDIAAQTTVMAQREDRSVAQIIGFALEIYLDLPSHGRDALRLIRAYGSVDDQRSATQAFASELCATAARIEHRRAAKPRDRQDSKQTGAPIPVSPAVTEASASRAEVLSEDYTTFASTGISPIPDAAKDTLGAAGQAGREDRAAESPIISPRSGVARIDELKRRARGALGDNFDVLEWTRASHSLLDGEIPLECAILSEEGLQRSLAALAADKAVLDELASPETRRLLLKILRKTDGHRLVPVLPSDQQSPA